jgi:phospholipase/carboxylesterase
METLAYLEREAAGEAEGLLVLHHGRGADEGDLFALADLFDPQRRLVVAAPRAPLTLPGLPGFHWYTVPRVGYPDAESFHTARTLIAAFHDELWARTGIEPSRTVLGGFSMGTVMSYAMGLGAGRPAVAGIMGFSGFVPMVDDWEPSFGDRLDTRAFIAHGRRDPIIEVGFGHRARRLLEEGGLEVEYHESDVGHQIDPTHLSAAVDWLAATLPRRH